MTLSNTEFSQTLVRQTNTKLICFSDIIIKGDRNKFAK